MIKTMLLIGASVLLITGVFFVVLSFGSKIQDTPSNPSYKDLMELGRAAESLREYAELHHGEYPQFNMAIPEERIKMKGVLIASNLPVVNVNYPRDDSDAKNYLFLYFPIDSSVNKALPLFGSKKKLIAASINIFYPSWNGRPYRRVASYHGGIALMDEAEFQNFLNGDTNAPSAVEGK